MKLSEIIVSPQTADLDVKHANAFISKIVMQGEIVAELTSKVKLFKYKDFYAIIRDDVGVGYAEFAKLTKIHDVSYLELKFIFVLPEYRKTRVSGLFLLGLQKHLGYPMILGTSVWGGVLFKDGLDAAKALLGSSAFTVSILNLETGDKNPATSSDFETAKNKTLVVEQEDIPFVSEGTIHKCFVFSDEL